MRRLVKLETIMEGVLAALISLLKETGAPSHSKLAIEERSGFSNEQVHDALLSGVDRGFIGEVLSGEYIPLSNLKGEPISVPSHEERQRILRKDEATATAIKTEERLQLIESQNRKLVSAFKTLKHEIEDAVNSLHNDLSEWHPVIEKLKEILQ